MQFVVLHKDRHSETIHRNAAMTDEGVISYAYGLLRISDALQVTATVGTLTIIAVPTPEQDDHDEMLASRELNAMCHRMQWTDFNRACLLENFLSRGKLWGQFLAYAKTVEADQSTDR